MDSFRFSNPVKVFVGRGNYQHVGEYTSSDRIMLISDPVISSLLFYSEIKDLLGGRILCEFTGIIPNPECETVDSAVELAREHQIDCIIAIGGGSTMDAAKVVAAISPGEGNVNDYITGARQFGKERTSLILMPTTAGTGSEVTNIAVITNRTLGKKIPLGNDLLFGDIAIIDSCLTETLPPKIVASSGFDALCHAIEAYWNRLSTPISDALALSAMKSVIANLNSAYSGNEVAKEQMGIASCLAGMAFNQTRTTVCHAISYRLTAVFGIEHGTACTITLVPFMKYNLDLMRQKFDFAGAYCGVGNAEGLIATVDDLYRQVKMQQHLSAFGITEKDIPLLTTEALAVASTKNNPREVTYEALISILSQLI